MENSVDQKRKEINEEIRKEVFDLEKDSYYQGTSSDSNVIVAKIKKIVEEKVKNDH